MNTTARRPAVMQLSQKFYFEAAHTLQRVFEVESSRRIHGHTYSGEVTVAGSADERSGMVMDLATLKTAIEVTREKLDHRLLDEVVGLGAATLENLCTYIARDMEAQFGGALVSVKVWREASGERRCMPAADGLNEDNEN